MDYQLRLPVNNPPRVQRVQREGQFGDIEPHHILAHGSRALEMEPQVTAKHQVQHHKQILVVLEGISQITDQRELDLLKQASLLDDVFDRAHADTFCLVDVLECIDLFGFLVLDYPYLAEGAFTDRTEEMKVGEFNYWTKNETKRGTGG